MRLDRQSGCGECVWRSVAASTDAGSGESGKGAGITVPKLFAENRPPYNIGLVGYWD